MREEREVIIKDTTKYFSSTVVSQIALICRGFIIPKLLVPSLYGIANGLYLVLDYSQYAHLGVLNGMGRDIPFYRGRQDFKRINNIKNTTLFFLSISSLFVSVMVLLYSIIKIRALPVQVTIGLQIFSLTLIVRNILNFYLILLRSDNNFTVLSKVTVLKALCSLGFGITLVFFFSIYGLFLSILAMGVVCLWYLRVKTPYEFKFCIDRSVIVKLLSIGFPILLISFMNVNFRTIGRILVLKYLDFTQLGYYAIGASLSNYLLTVPYVFGEVLAPRIYEKSGKIDNGMGMTRYLTDPTLIICCIMATVTGLMYLVAPAIIHILLPQYTKGVIPTKILVLATYFPSIVMSAGSILIGFRKVWNIVCLQGIALMLNFFLSLYLLKVGMGITGVALGTALSNVFYSAAILFYASFLSFKNFRKSINLVGKAFLFFLFVFIVTQVLDVFYRIQPSRGTLEILLILVLKVLILFGACLPMFWYINTKTGIISQTFQMMKAKLQYKHDE